MKCPSCGSVDDEVRDSRDGGDRVRRRRECQACKQRFTTYETIAQGPMVRGDLARERESAIAALDRFITAAGTSATFLLPSLTVDIMDGAARVPELLESMHVLKTPPEDGNRR
jgi:hypothetical protein